jgi:RHS repeat-associated protein
VYVYGHDLISQDQLNGSAWVASFYGYDGHGSVRYLTEPSGAVTDAYDYDAFGDLIAVEGDTPNLYLYCGEQFDADLGLYYNRARYLNADSGRFWTRDAFEGAIGQPLSLHTYLYAHANPIHYQDPSGYAVFSGEQSIVSQIQGIISSGVRANYRLVVRKGACELVEIGVEQATEYAIAEAGLYLFEHASGIPGHPGKGGKPYAGQSSWNVDQRIKSLF